MSIETVSTAQAGTCTECGEQLPDGVLDALDLLYGSSHVYLSSLATAISVCLQLDDRLVQHGRQSTDHQVIANSALHSWLGTTVDNLVAAVRHRDGGECERIQNARSC